jgi:hypothetical protein
MAPKARPRAEGPEETPQVTLAPGVQVFVTLNAKGARIFKCPVCPDEIAYRDGRSKHSFKTHYESHVKLMARSQPHAPPIASAVSISTPSPTASPVPKPLLEKLLIATSSTGASTPSPITSARVSAASSRDQSRAASLTRQFDTVCPPCSQSWLQLGCCPLNVQGFL